MRGLSSENPLSFAENEDDEQVDALMTEKTFEA